MGPASRVSAVDDSKHQSLGELLQVEHTTHIPDGLQGNRQGDGFKGHPGLALSSNCKWPQTSKTSEIVSTSPVTISGTWGPPWL